MGGVDPQGHRIGGWVQLERPNLELAFRDRDQNYRDPLVGPQVLWPQAATSRMTTPKRCAIYTRKSTEEGLEQAFNSLHAQREACEAFIKSQAHEGWRLIKTAYDDGGLSGGNLDR